MTDQPSTPEQDPAAEAAPDAEPVADGAGSESRSAQAREWLGQLQHMIDRITTEATPVAREIAAKAAELAAVAGEKAGPIAKRAAEVTGDVGSRVAERSRRFADEIRHRGNGSPSGDAATDAAPSSDETPALDQAGDEGAAPSD